VQGAVKKKEATSVSKYFFWRLRGQKIGIFYRVFGLPLLRNAQKTRLKEVDEKIKIKLEK
jgi:hypothetical protein